jgi:hypothetical protein
VDTPTLPIDDIHNLFSDLAVPDGVTEQPVELEKSLTALNEALKTAAPSYRGLALTVVIDKQPISVTSAELGNTSDIATSLRLSLAWVPSLSADSRITFYASTPGTFVDLAADLAFALDSDIRLDEDIPPVLVSDLTGVGRLSAVNKAVGVLVGHGHTPDSAQREPRHMADATPSSIQKAAEAVTNNPSSALWNRHRSFGHHPTDGARRASARDSSVACWAPCGSEVVRSVHPRRGRRCGDM